MRDGDGDWAKIPMNMEPLKKGYLFPGEVPERISNLRAELAEVTAGGGRYWDQDGWIMNARAEIEKEIATLLDRLKSGNRGPS